MRKIWVVLIVIFIGLFGSITAANYWLKHRMDKEETRPSSPKNPNPSLLYPTGIQNKAQEAPSRPSPKPSPKGTQEKKIIYEFPLDDAILVQ